MMRKALTIILVSIMLIALLAGCEKKNEENVNPEEVKEHLIGEWRWEGNNQTGRWIFYENNTMLAEFTGKFAGAKSIAWWEYHIKGDEICFTNCSNPRLTPGCYKYEFLENYTILKVSYGDQVAYWYKVKD